MRRWITAVLMSAAFCCVTLTTAATAQAHAAFESSNPAAGAVVSELPDVVELTFTEAIGQPSAVGVTDPSGVNVETGELSVIDGTASQPISVSDPQPGSYVIAYQVTSADGHPISGTVAFTLDAPAASAATPAAATTTTATTTVPAAQTEAPAADHSSSAHAMPALSIPLVLPIATSSTTTMPSAASASDEEGAADPTTAVAAAVPESPTSGGTSDRSDNLLIALLLVVAAAGTVGAGFAVRRSVRQMTVSAETTPA